MLSIPKERAPKLAVAGATLLSLVAALFYYRAWLLHLNVPIAISGDAVQKLELVTATVRHGWFLDVPTIGLPGHGEHFDFPRYDSLNYAVIKGIAWGLRDAVISANVYYLLGYPLVALTSAIVLLRLGVPALWSFVGAVAYALFPYHFLRGFQQFTNAEYVLVPFAFLFLRRVWYPPHGGERWSRMQWTGWIALAIALELQNVYYALFSALLVASCAVAFVALRGWRSARTALVKSAVLLGAVALTFAAEQSPRWLFEASNGKNSLAVNRPPSGVSEFALSVVDLLNPSPDHPLHFLAHWTQAAATFRGVKHNERVVATLPSLGLLGLAIAIYALVRRAKRLEPGDQRRLIQQWAGGLIVVCLLWCHEGGLCTLISETGFGLIRGWNRMSIFIGFAAVLAAVTWLDGKSASFSRRRRAGFATAVMTLVLAEQLFSSSRDSYAASAAKLDEAKQLTSEITADGKLHRAFILPYFEYPEAGKVGDIQDYDHFIFPIASDRIEIVYGSMRGRGASYYSSAATALPGPELVPYLKDGGFDTIVIDRLAPATAKLEQEFVTTLGSPIARTPRYLAYRIGRPLEEHPAEATWRAYSLGTPLNFRDVVTRRFLELNFSVFEPDGTWTEGLQAALRLGTARLPNGLVLTIQGQLFEERKRPQRVHVSFDGMPVCLLERAGRDIGIIQQWVCRFRTPAQALALPVHEVGFLIEHPLSPSSLEQSADTRLLGLRLVSLQLNPGDSIVAAHAHRAGVIDPNR